MDIQDNCKKCLCNDHILNALLLGMLGNIFSRRHIEILFLFFFFFFFFFFQKNRL